MNDSSEEILSGRVAGVTKRRHRKCTDIISLLLFVSMLGATAYMTYEAMQYEDYDMECAVNRPRQWNGEMCHLDQVLRWPYRNHPDPAVKTFAVCENECASNEQQIWFYCVPVKLDNVANAICKSQLIASQYARVALRQAYLTREQLLWGVLFAFVIGIAFCVFYQNLGEIGFWVASVSGIIVAGLQSYEFLEKYYNPPAHTFACSADLWSGLGLALFTLLLIVIFYIVRSRIHIAFAVLEQAMNAIFAVPSVLLVPILGLGLMLLYIFGWIYIGVMLFNVRTGTEMQRSLPVKDSLELPQQWQVFGIRQDMQHWAIFHVFGLFWSISFIFNFVYTVISGVIADWYFTPIVNGRKRRGSGPGKLSRLAVLSSLRRTIRHTGSVALASLILAICTCLSCIFEYLKSISEAQNNPIQQVLFQILSCCSWCMTVIISQVSENGLIVTAIRGSDFFSGTTEAFQLVWANLARSTALNIVSRLAMILSAIVTILATSYFVYTTVDGMEGIDARIPAACAAFLALLTSSAFMVAYDSAIDTLFICFLLDEEENKGRYNFAPEDLGEVIQLTCKAAIEARRSKQLAASSKPQRNDDDHLENV